MAESASTGNGRRRVLRTAALLPAALAAGPRAAAATDYASAEDAFAAIDQLEAEVVARLRRLEADVKVARSFAASLLRDHDRHRREREALRHDLGLVGTTPAAPPPAPNDVLDLAALKETQERLMYAHAEDLPILGQAPAVRELAHHMVDQSRHLTLLGLWVEAEEERG
jgi:hypothetical protein